MLKRMIAVLLAAVLLTGFALAEDIAVVGDYVAQMGYKAETAKNKSGAIVCDYYEPAKGAHSLVWSDKKTVYTITTTRKKDAMKALYVDLLGMYDWDSCTYTAGDEVQFAFNAPSINAVKSYKTLTNYTKAVQKYIGMDGAVVDAAPTEKSSGGQKNYVLNTSTKKFHLPSCNDLSKMKDENRKNTRSNRDQLIADGYSPCEHCNP